MCLEQVALAGLLTSRRHWWRLLLQLLPLEFAGGYAITRSSLLRGLSDRLSVEPAVASHAERRWT